MNIIRKIVSFFSTSKKKQNQLHTHSKAREELDIEISFKKAVTGLEIKLKEEIKLSYREYEIEYAQLKKRFGKVEKGDVFLALERELDERYKRKSKALGEKYAELKNKLLAEMLNSMKELRKLP